MFFNMSCLKFLIRHPFHLYSGFPCSRERRLDSRLRGNDGIEDCQIFTEIPITKLEILPLELPKTLFQQ